ncbi:hypothetical protein GZH46_01010, partial [Fragariocoptes setiger]
MKYSIIVIGLVCLVGAAIAQDYDNENENYGNGNGGDEGYGNYGGDDGYSGYQPSQNSGVAAESSDVQPGYSSQGSSDADGDYENDEIARAASIIKPTIARVRRSVSNDEHISASAPKIRVKRGGKHYIGPVYTYVKTDKHANFKWGIG